MAVESATYIVAASCVVHNVCELRRDDFLQEWLDVREETNQPDNIGVQARDHESDASIIRDTLAEYFLNEEGRNLGIGGQ